MSPIAKRSPHHFPVPFKLEYRLHKNYPQGRRMTVSLHDVSPPCNPHLQHHDLGSIFSEIITNPASFNSAGLLEISRRVPATSADQHSCKVGCSANMCKGQELEAFLERTGGRAQYDRIVYVGDGSNDFCPLLRLTR